MQTAVRSCFERFRLKPEKPENMESIVTALISSHSRGYWIVFGLKLFYRDYGAQSQSSVVSNCNNKLLKNLANELRLPLWPKSDN